MIAEEYAAIFYRIFIVIVIILATIIIGKFAEKLFKGGTRKAGVPEVEATLASSLLKYLIYFVGFIEILTYVGFSSIPILFAIAVVGIVLAISSHSILENATSGYVLRVRKPFNVGDLVKIGNKVGEIKDWDLVYTTIETTDHQCYILPNSEIANSKIFNLTRSKFKFPIEFEFRVPLNLNILNVKKKILDIIGDYCGIDPNLPIMLSANEMKADGINLKIRFYVLEFESINEAKDVLITEISKLVNNSEQRMFSKEKLETATNDLESAKIGTQACIRCPMCDSERWIGYLRCKKTSNYYLYGKCVGCDHLRLDKCPVDGGELEFVRNQKTNRKKGKNDS